MKKTFSALFATLLFLSGALFAAETPKVKKQLPFTKGINLPVWMEYGRFNTLLYGKKDFENIKSLGVEAVRVPVWFDVWADKSNDYKLDPGCFEILDRAVNWCEQMGMYIIIDFQRLQRRLANQSKNRKRSAKNLAPNSGTLQKEKQLCHLRDNERAPL